MALKDEDTLMKRKKELEEAMQNLGLSLEEKEEEYKDELADMFAFDEAELDKMHAQKEQK